MAYRLCLRPSIARKNIGTGPEPIAVGSRPLIPGTEALNAKEGERGDHRANSKIAKRMAAFRKGASAVELPQVTRDDVAPVFLTTPPAHKPAAPVPKKRPVSGLKKRRERRSGRRLTVARAPRVGRVDRRVSTLQRKRTVHKLHLLANAAAIDDESVSASYRGDHQATGCRASIWISHKQHSAVTTPALWDFGYSIHGSQQSRGDSDRIAVGQRLKL